MVGTLTVLTLALIAYAGGHYFALVVFLLGGRAPRPRETPTDAVTVLIPARNEGAAALHAITSALEQDHAGPITVQLLVADAGDDALAGVRRAFGLAEGERHAEPSPGRRLELRLLGIDAKAAKIRAAVETVDTSYVAILDADHIAHPQWIRSALGHLARARADGSPARMIQCRRYPIAARGFFRFWDSLHQHVGCELLNVAFQKLGLTVFFTGTTAVLETALLRAHPLRDVITEDIDFSYELFFAGELILSDPRYGSSEELSPDLYSFLARRRRWSSGHTEAFFRHLPKLFRARLPILAKAQFLFHGLHYLIALPVFVLHVLVGVLFARALPEHAVVASLLSALLLAHLTTRTQGTLGVVHRSLELAVVFAWLAPALLIAMNLVLALLTGDVARAALPLPAEDTYLQPLALAAFAAPLFVVLVGLLRFGQLGVGTFLGLLSTYPIAFYLDGAGSMLGLLDQLLGRRRWRPVARERGDELERAPTPVDLEESWRLGGGVSLTPREPPPGRWTPRFLAVAAALSFTFGIFGWPERVVAARSVRCEPRQADDLPWIEPIEGLGHCEISGAPRFALRSGSAHVERDDDLRRVDDTFWVRGDATFPCNESHFRPANVVATGEEGVRFELRREAHADRRYTSGALATRDEKGARHRYGRFEVEMKPSDVSGVVSAFFLYRFDPWQEIDFEFVGNDTTKALLNVYYNPGKEGDLYNYGHFGTPVMVDLGFDAADGFHRYAIEWDREEIRWFADDRLIHVRRSGEPTPIPHLPMVFHLNTWATCSETLAGPFEDARLPTSASFRRVIVSRWDAAPRTGLDVLFGFGDPERDGWMAPE